MSRVSRDTSVPVAMRLETGKVERQCQDARVVTLKELERCGKNEVCAHRDQRSHQIVLNPGLDRTPETELVEFRIHQTGALPPAGHMDVTEAEIVINRQLLLGERVVLTQHARISVAAQRLLFEVRVVNQRRIDRKIDRAARQFFGNVSARREIALDAYAGCEAL